MALRRELVEVDAVDDLADDDAGQAVVVGVDFDDANDVRVVELEPDAPAAQQALARVGIVGVHDLDAHELAARRVPGLVEIARLATRDALVQHEAAHGLASEVAPVGADGPRAGRFKRWRVRDRRRARGTGRRLRWADDGGIGDRRAGKRCRGWRRGQAGEGSCDVTLADEIVSARRPQGRDEHRCVPMMFKRLEHLRDLAHGRRPPIDRLFQTRVDQADQSRRQAGHPLRHGLGLVVQRARGRADGWDGRVGAQRAGRAQCLGS